MSGLAVTLHCTDCRWGKREGLCGHYLRATFSAGERMPCGGRLYLPLAGSAAYRAHQARLHANRTRRYRERMRQAGNRIVSLRLTASEADLLATMARERGIPPRELVARLLAAERERTSFATCEGVSA